LLLLFAVLLASPALSGCNTTASPEPAAEQPATTPPITDEPEPAPVLPSSTSEPEPTPATAPAMIAPEPEITMTPEPLPETAPEPETTPSTEPQEVIRLYYYGASSIGSDPAALPGEHCVYSATSSDGIKFTEDAGVRLAYDTGAEFGIVDPDIVRLNDGSWLMLVGKVPHYLMKATAADSTGDFTIDESFNWSKGSTPDAFNFDGTVRAFTGYQNGIHAGTYDQESGTLKYTGVAIRPPSAGLLADPSVIQVGNEYLMFYKYQDSPSAPPPDHEIYVSTSLDGITWTQHPDNRYVCNGSVPGAVYYAGTIYVYFCGGGGRPGSSRGDMGVAVSDDSGATFALSTITVAGKQAPGIVDPAATVVSTAEPAP